MALMHVYVKYVLLEECLLLYMMLLLLTYMTLQNNSISIRRVMTLCESETCNLIYLLFSIGDFLLSLD